MRASLVLCLLAIQAVLSYRKNLNGRLSPRFSIYKVSTTHVPAVASNSRASSPAHDYSYLLTSPPAIFCSKPWSMDGSCFAIDCPLPEMRTPSPPPYGYFTPPLPIIKDNPQQTPNRTSFLLQCNPPYQLADGTNTFTCQNGDWQGGNDLGTCACAKPPGWCYLTDTRNVYSYTDCDGDGVRDHVCQDFDPDSGGLTRSVISSKNQCQGTMGLAVDACPSIFDRFPVAVVGKCEGQGFNYVSGPRTFSECAQECYRDTAWCWAFSWSSTLRQCYTGQVHSCDFTDRTWIGGSTGCVRPTNWCMSPQLGDEYQFIDCDGDYKQDHVCVNGNTGGRIASRSGCHDNWPLAENADCHAGFD